MDKIILQSFWTSPMHPDQLQTNFYIAAISLYYAHRSGYKVHMHTDSQGMQLLQDLNYDKILPTLDNIPKDTSSRLAAYGKIIALENEPIGTIHTDFDVFIKKPCLDDFFQCKDIDIIVQCKESSLFQDYYRLRDYFKQQGVIDELAINQMTPYCVGILGFNNESLKNEYIYRYKTCAEYYKDKLGECPHWPDLYFEQINIGDIIENRDCLTQLLLGKIKYKNPNINKIADRIGYQHLQGDWKSSNKGREFIKNFYNKLISIQDNYDKIFRN